MRSCTSSMQFLVALVALLEATHAARVPTQAIARAAQTLNHDVVSSARSGRPGALHVPRTITTQASAGNGFPISSDQHHIASSIAEDAGTTNYDSIVVNTQLSTAATTHGRQAYVVKDGSGLISVVEQETRALPDGGTYTWQRTTGPGSVTVTAVKTITSSSDSSADHAQSASSDIIVQPVLQSTSSSSVSDVQRLTSTVHDSHVPVGLTNLLSGALAPLNQLLEVLDQQQQHTADVVMAGAAVQQQLAGIAAMQQQQRQPVLQAVNAVAAPDMGALIREHVTATTAAVQQQQAFMQSQLQELLQKQAAAMAIDSTRMLHIQGFEAPEPQHVGRFHMDDYIYVNPTAKPADGVFDYVYDIDSSNGVHSGESAYAAQEDDYYLDDIILDKSSVLRAVWEAVQAADIDSPLMVSLVMGTVVMCCAFMHSLVQLRAVLAAQESSATDADYTVCPVCDVPGSKTGLSNNGDSSRKGLACPAAGAIAAARSCCTAVAAMIGSNNNGNGSTDFTISSRRCGYDCDCEADSDNDDLIMPLLLDGHDLRSAQEHQGTAVAAARPAPVSSLVPGIQRFYNPAYSYQPPPRKM